MDALELFTKNLQYAKRIEIELPRAQLEAMPRAELARYQALIDRAVELGFSVISWVESIGATQHLVILPPEENTRGSDEPTARPA